MGIYKDIKIEKNTKYHSGPLTAADPEQKNPAQNCAGRFQCFGI